MVEELNSWVVQQSDEGKRLDIFLRERLDTSRSQIQKKIERGEVKMNNSRVSKSGEMLSHGDEITVYPRNQKSASEAKKQRDNLNVKLIKETKNYLVVNKPAGLLVHPTAAKEKVTLVHWLLDRYPEIKTVGEFDDRPGVVHRLDRDTSGLLVVARTQEMFEHLKRQFKQRKTEKRYTALVHGKIESHSDTIKLPIDRGSEGKMVAKPKGSAEGKKAITKFKLLRKFSRYSLIDVQIITGRTHQIRVHMYAYNHPIVGDEMYIQKNINRNLDKKLGRLFLHARKLCFYDLKNQKICADSKLPKKLQKTLEELN